MTTNTKKQPRTQTKIRPPKEAEVVSNKIHFTGYPCGIAARSPHKSMMLSSNSDPDQVTCKGCIAICLKIAKAWAKKLPQDKTMKELKNKARVNLPKPK